MKRRSPLLGAEGGANSVRALGPAAEERHHRREQLRSNRNVRAAREYVVAVALDLLEN